ncbi:ureidoglycolate lyase [Spirulina sp. 06S082]|uniref:ureidoglycolate lyase n=1 Tax=Spirulina sp. 06S082 TaxID=3110248 RepID=UPI002B206633|nr:ureidoglycolate lyase [Spirulina sp. 06S082]MEA5469994.1 ureidoglycolate lyase [Spirulina sp. 06S082]
MTELNYHEVPLKPLNPENARGLGIVFTEIAEVQIELCKWPTSGKRPLIAKGGYGTVIEEEFTIYRKGSTLFSAGHQNARGGATGKIISKPNSNTPYILVNWLSAHLDAGEAFIPKNGEPSIFLVAPPQEDVKPEDFVALYSDGTLGISMHPGVWHTTPLSLCEREIVYQRKQGSIYATVDCFLSKEHNACLKIPLGQPEIG